MSAMMMVKPRRPRFFGGTGGASGAAGIAVADGCPAGAGLDTEFSMEGEFVSGFEGSMTQILA
jgi:hypothetical protein